MNNYNSEPPPFQSGMMLEKKKIIKKQILIIPNILLFLSLISYFSFSYIVIGASLVKNRNSVVKNKPADADVGLISGCGRFPGEGNGNPFRYSCLENPTDRGA